MTNQPGIKAKPIAITMIEPTEVLASIAGVRATFDSKTRSIEDWRVSYRQDLANARQRPSIAIFTSFVNNLLERAMPGEAWSRRVQAAQRLFVSLDSVTDQTAQQVLTEASYRFPSDGVHVILAAKDFVSQPGFSWTGYIQRAEDQYETDFRSDPFLRIRGVGYKTRDLALSELSDRFVAIDLHVVRVTTRTGLLLHGYGDPRITTEVGKEAGYMFFHGLMLKLSRRTGWPAAGYAPGEIDRMLWHFGRTVCGATPGCQACPLAEVCLTSRDSISPESRSSGSAIC